MKQVRRSVKQILFSLTLVMVFFINIHPVMAQEISNESKNAIWNEFEEKRENGLEVYELLDDNGNSSRKIFIWRESVYSFIRF